MGSRMIIVGDVHGCEQQLRSLLNKCRLNTEKDTLVLLGDAFDRGKDSYGVYQYLLELEKDMGQRFIYVLGNHDQMLIDAEISWENQYLWVQNGAAETLQSFENAGREIDVCRSWLKDKPCWYECEECICVHAGLENAGPEETGKDMLLWDRSVLTGKRIYTGKLAVTGHTPIGSTVYIDDKGENSQPLEGQCYPLPERGQFVIDTGCVYYGKLTAMIKEGKQYQIISV